MNRSVKSIKTVNDTPQYKLGFKDASKAFGGCTKCYGKGYSTQGHAGRMQIHLCKCERGKQLERVMDTLS